MFEERGWSAIGERVRQVRMSMKMSQQDLALAINLDRTMIAKVEAGNRRLDALELARISSTLRVSMDYLLHPRPAVLSRRMELLTEDTDTEVARKSQRLEIELVSWLHEVRQLIDLGLLRPQPLMPYEGEVRTHDDARRAAGWVRNRLGYGEEPIASLMQLCERAGQLVLVTELPGDGASVVDDRVAVAVVSLEGDPGRRRVTAAHELGHLVLGDEYSSDLGVYASRADREAVIDAFAAELLLPMRVVAAAAASDDLTRDDLLRLAARYRTSWSLALSQAEQAGVLDFATRHRWSRSRPTRAEFMEALGWVPQPDLESVRVPPSYANAVMAAWRADLITSARAIELMHGQITETDLPVRDDPAA